MKIYYVFICRIFVSFTAVQHERAPRSASQAGLHHYPLGLSSKLGRFHATTFFPSLPIHLQNPPILDPAITNSIPGNSYIPPNFLYHGMFGALPKPAILSPNLSKPS